MSALAATPRTYLPLSEAWALLGDALDDPRPITLVSELQHELRTSANAALWRGERSVVFLRITECENGERICEAAPAGGDLSEILSLGTVEIEAFARQRGCTQIHALAGRDGWEKALAPYGYEPAAVLLRKLL